MASSSRSEFREVTTDRLAPIIILSAVLDLGTRVGRPRRRRGRLRDQAVRSARARGARPRAVPHARARDPHAPRRTAVDARRCSRPASPTSCATPRTGWSMRSAAVQDADAAGADEARRAVGRLLDVMGECAAQINTLSKQLLGFRGTARASVQPSRSTRSFSGRRRSRDRARRRRCRVPSRRP